MPQRAYSIDLLRGVAILGMVLSGQMLWNAGLPPWMFHAQVPPPAFVFDPGVAGITWVDLVFPFFLFAMGAAFPLALRCRIAEGRSHLSIGTGVAVRWALLTLFAVALGNLRPAALGDALPEWGKALVQLAVWGLFCLLFVRSRRLSPSRNAYLRLAGAAGLVVLMLASRYLLHAPASVHRSDIIILVLANMALFGTAVWWTTRDNLLARLAILALIAALKLGSEVEGSWNAALWGWTPAAWLFRVEYLKYLCIIIPGTIAGDLLSRSLNHAPARPAEAKPAGGQSTRSQPDARQAPLQPAGEQSDPAQTAQSGSAQTAALSHRAVVGSLLALTLVAVNLWGLFARQLAANLVATLLVGLAARQLLRRERPAGAIFGWGLFWLVLGLTLEALEGGIKKDYATLSYFFVTAGLASAVVAAAHTLLTEPGRGTRWLVRCGQNPMVAYTAAGFVLLPLVTLTRLSGPLARFAALTPWCGFWRGVVVTALVAVFTVLLTQRKILWRT